MKCNACKKDLQDGDTAYEIGVKRITVVGRTVREFQENVYVCQLCYIVECPPDCEGRSRVDVIWDAAGGTGTYCPVCKKPRKHG